MPLTLILSPEGRGKGEGDIRKFHELPVDIYFAFSTQQKDS
jgi:hypothetical protein